MNPQNLTSVMEFLPVILASVLLMMGISNKSMLDFKMALIISLLAFSYITIQVSWWWLHFFAGVDRLPLEFHLGWAAYDSAVMLVLIYALRRR